MTTLPSKKRAGTEKAEALRKGGFLPAILYGPKLTNQQLAVDAKNFRKVYEESGESTLISLDLEGDKHIVLIHDVQLNPISGDFTHVDFYQPRLDEEIEIAVPLVFEGEAPAVLE